MRFLLLLNLAGKIAAVFVFAQSAATALALWFVPDALLAYHMFVPRAQGLLRVHRRFSTTEREVWLTIDDGPDPEDTPQLLELLAQHGARATFFVIGENVRRRPDLVHAMVAAGHEVAHHTQTHPLGDFWCASPSRVGRELDDCLAVLREAGLKPTRFRTPAGLKNFWLGGELRKRSLTCVGWTARGLETRKRHPDEVVARLTRRVEPGAILLTHEGPRVPQAIRVAAIRGLLEFLREHGYRCVIPDPGQLAREPVAGLLVRPTSEAIALTGPRRSHRTGR